MHSMCDKWLCWFSKKGHKRPLAIEYVDILSIEQPSDGYNAKLHGVVTSLSPIKGSKLFLDGNLSNGKSKMCLVGFRSEGRK